MEFLKSKYSTSDLKAAFKDLRIKKLIQKHVKEERIQFRDKVSREPIFKREMNLIGEKGDDAIKNYSPDLVANDH